MYAYAEDPDHNARPAELRLADAIARFGVMAATGRAVLWAHEITRIQYAENLLSAYKVRNESGDWSVFTSQHPFWAGELFNVASLEDGG